MWPFRKKKPAGLIIDETHRDPAARALRDALKARDWKSARDVFEPVADPDDRTYLMSIAAGVDGVQEWVGEWQAAEPGSTLPLLFKGCHGVFWAWEARGSAGSEHTKEEQFREFWRRLRIAENALDDVVARDPDDVTARAWLVTSARGRQVDATEARLRFDEVVKRHPGHVVAHEQMLQYLCAKWFGSEEQMFEFARSATAAAPPASLVPNILAAAHLEKYLSVNSAEHMETDAVRAELLAAAEKSVLHPSFRPRFGWQSRGNTFAMALAWADLHDAAARVFDLLGDQPTEWPWQYRNGGDPVSVFTDYRDISYANRSA
jgi:hypothetical protein